MKVLVCGGAGYIGSQMVQFLLEEGHESVTLDNLSTGHVEAPSATAVFSVPPTTKATRMSASVGYVHQYQRAPSNSDRHCRG